MQIQQELNWLLKTAYEVLLSAPARNVLISQSRGLSNGISPAQKASHAQADRKIAVEKNSLSHPCYQRECLHCRDIDRFYSGQRLRHECTIDESKTESEGNVAFALELP